MEGWGNRRDGSGEQAQSASHLVMMDPFSFRCPGDWPRSLSGPLKGEGQSGVWNSLGTHSKPGLPPPTAPKYIGSTPSFCGQGWHTREFTTRLPCACNQPAQDSGLVTHCSLHTSGEALWPITAERRGLP